MAAATRSSRIILIVAALLAVAAVIVGITRARRDIGQVDSATATAPAGPVAADPAAMIAQLEAKLKANPNDVRGWRLLGVSFQQSGRFAESAAAWKRAVAIAPADAESWSSLGEALALAGPTPPSPEARVAFRTALTHDANDPRAAYYLAVARDMDGDHKGALDDLFGLLSRSPADAPWLTDVRKAISDIAGANKIDVATRLAGVKLKAPLSSIATAAIPGASREAMQQAAQLPKGQQDAMITQMVEGLDQKLAANPKDVDRWIMLMRSRVTLGETAKAKAALATAKAANPGDSAKLDTAARELGLPLS